MRILFITLNFVNGLWFPFEFHYYYYWLVCIGDVYNRANILNFFMYGSLTVMIYYSQYRALFICIFVCSIFTWLLICLLWSGIFLCDFSFIFFSVGGSREGNLVRIMDFKNLRGEQVSYDDDTIELMLSRPPLQQFYWLALAVSSPCMFCGRRGRPSLLL